jgi:hypothetical protein
MEIIKKNIYLVGDEQQKIATIEVNKTYNEKRITFHCKEFGNTEDSIPIETLEELLSLLKTLD